MTIQVINVLLYLFLFLFWKRTNKHCNIGVMIVPLMLLITAALCAITSLQGPTTWHLTLFPFVYLFLSFCILLIPLLRICPKAGDKIVVSNLGIVRVFVNIFIFLSIATIFIRLQGAINAMLSGDWLTIRTEMYQADEPVYNSFFERLAINGSGFLSTLGAVYFFYCISNLNKRKISNFYIILLGMAVLLPPVITSISNAARGSLFFFGLKMLVVTLVFYNHYSSGIKKGIRWGAIILATLFLSLSIAITLSRFSTDSNSSLLYYFGHSMNAFNYGVMDSIKYYSGGQWFLGDYYSLVGHKPISMEASGTHFASSFITIMGCMLYDFGPIYSLVVVIIIVTFFNRKHKGNIEISDVYLYVVYSELLIEGVFVCGVAYGVKLFVKLLIYYVISRKLFMAQRAKFSKVYIKDDKELV